MGKDNDQLVPRRPRSLLEKIFGIAGGISAAAWLFTLFLHLIDAISRVQTVMALEPYVHYFVTWWAQLIELGLAVTFIVAATKIEQSRETEDAPRIILLGTREPTPIQRDRLWIKVAAGGVLFAAISAGVVFLVVKRSKPIPQPIAVVPTLRPSGVPLQAKAPHPKVPSVDHLPKKKIPPTEAQAKPQSSPSKLASVVIPVPIQAVPPAKDVSGKPSVKYVASIAGKVVEAKSKIPGTLTVALGATSNSRYLGNISPDDVTKVAGALEKTGKVSVFLNPSPGSYQISGNGLGYSMSITQIHARTIYYFDNRLETACLAIKTIVTSVVGGRVDCTFTSVQPPTDPNQPNVQYDFLVHSGLDMEIDL